MYIATKQSHLVKKDAQPKEILMTNSKGKFIYLCGCCSTPIYEGDHYEAREGFLLCSNCLEVLKKEKSEAISSDVVETGIQK